MAASLGFAQRGSNETHRKIRGAKREGDERASRPNLGPAPLHFGGAPLLFPDRSTRTVGWTGSQHYHHVHSHHPT